MHRRPLVVAGTFSLLILAANAAFPAAALTDPSGALLPPTVHLAFPLVNLLFAPLFDLWDEVTLLAMPLLHAFLVGAVVLIAAVALGGARRTPGFDWTRATKRLAFGLACLGLFILAGIAWRRPMARLAGVPSDRYVVDLHSHTSLSRDAQTLWQHDFDLDASRAWHRRAGYDAFFVTDHDRGGIAPHGGRFDEPAACPGEELSLWRAHIVVLGNFDSIPKPQYADSEPGIERLMHESESRWGGVTLASIPEYDENHFRDLPAWIAAGVDGFEVSNAAPKANVQSRAHRDSVVALARANGKWLAGVSDQHGMGATAQAWTLVPRLPPGVPDILVPHQCREILTVLMTQGFGATQVVERHRVRMDGGWPVWAAVITVPWEGWRAASGLQLASWLAWTWAIALLAAFRRPRATA